MKDCQVFDLLRCTGILIRSVRRHITDPVLDQPILKSWDVAYEKYSSSDLSRTKLCPRELWYVKVASHRPSGSITCFSYYKIPSTYIVEQLHDKNEPIKISKSRCLDFFYNERNVGWIKRAESLELVCISLSPECATSIGHTIGMGEQWSRTYEMPW